MDRDTEYVNREPWVFVAECRMLLPGGDEWSRWAWHFSGTYDECLVALLQEIDYDMAEGFTGDCEYRIVEGIYTVLHWSREELLEHERVTKAADIQGV